MGSSTIKHQQVSLTNVPPNRSILSTYPSERARSYTSRPQVTMSGTAGSKELPIKIRQRDFGVAALATVVCSFTSIGDISTFVDRSINDVGRCHRLEPGERFLLHLKDGDLSVEELAGDHHAHGEYRLSVAENERRGRAVSLSNISKMAPLPPHEPRPLGTTRILPVRLSPCSG
jgi:hypothetical protein